jgi:hypothetical protein
MPPQYVTIHNFFMDDEHRELLHGRNEASQQVADRNCKIQLNEAHKSHKIPNQVHVYHSLYPLENNTERHSSLFGYSTAVYKAIRSIDGKRYVLRRIENYLLGNESSIALIEAWRKIKHPGIVSVNEGFTTKSFGDTCINCQP